MQSKQAQHDVDWLTSGEAAALAGISRDTIKRYEQRGLISSVRTPTGHRRFRRVDVERLLQPAPREDGAA